MKTPEAIPFSSRLNSRLSFQARRIQGYLTLDFSILYFPRDWGIHFLR
jgi:hypothetical protein